MTPQSTCQPCGGRGWYLTRQYDPVFSYVYHDCPFCGGKGRLRYKRNAWTDLKDNVQATGDAGQLEMPL